MRLLVQIMNYDGLLIRFAANHQWHYHVENKKGVTILKLWLSLNISWPIQIPCFVLLWLYVEFLNLQK